LSIGYTTKLSNTVGSFFAIFKKTLTFFPYSNVKVLPKKVSPSVIDIDIVAPEFGMFREYVPAGKYNGLFVT
jgi:hypothetical protein